VVFNVIECQLKQNFMERRLGHFFLNNEMFFQHQILTFFTQIFQ